MTQLKVTNHWTEYSAIISQSFDRYYLDTLFNPAVQSMLQRQYDKVVKLGKAMPYRIGIQFMMLQEYGLDYGEIWKAIEGG